MFDREQRPWVQVSAASADYAAAAIEQRSAGELRYQRPHGKCPRRVRAFSLRTSHSVRTVSRTRPAGPRSLNGRGVFPFGVQRRVNVASSEDVVALSKKLGAQFGGVVTDRVIDSGGLLKAHDVERYPTAVETGAAIAGAASGLTAGRSRPGAKIRYRAPVMTNVETPPRAPLRRRRGARPSTWSCLGWRRVKDSSVTIGR